MTSIAFSFDGVTKRFGRWDSALAQRILQRFTIDFRSKLTTMSLGQQRAVGLMLALCPRPELTVLDEPAANLDPVMRAEFLALVLELVAEQGNTVLFIFLAVGPDRRRPPLWAAQWSRWTAVWVESALMIVVLISQL